MGQAAKPRDGAVDRVEAIALVSLQAATRSEVARIAEVLESAGITAFIPARLLISRGDAKQIEGRRPDAVVATLATEAPGIPDLRRALHEARTRGDALKQGLLSDPDMLSTAGMAERLGMSEEGVRLKRKRHEVLGLEFAKRGIRYPGWQIMENHQMLPGLAHLSGILGHNPWATYRFLLQHHPELDGLRALDALRHGRTAAVIATAANVAIGGFS